MLTSTILKLFNSLIKQSLHKGKYHCTADLLFGQFEFSSLAFITALLYWLNPNQYWLNPNQYLKQEANNTVMLPLTNKLIEYCVIKIFCPRHLVTLGT